MSVEGAGDVDVRIAHELAALLRDDGLWGDIDPSGAGGEGPDDLAAKALDLYALTGTVLARRVGDWATPLDWAMGAVRDIADACAILTMPWPSEDLVSRPIPSRVEIEAIIRRFGVSEWASELGVDLPLVTAPSETDLVPEASEGDLNGELTAAELASRWTTQVSAFRRAAGLRFADEEARADLQGGEIRNAAAAGVAVARVWLYWARQFSQTDVVAVAVTNLFAAQGLFVVCWEREPDPRLFPEDDYLREFLALERGGEWLVDHGAEVPSELLE